MKIEFKESDTEKLVSQLKEINLLTDQTQENIDELGKLTREVYNLKRVLIFLLALLLAFALVYFAFVS